MQNPPAGAAHCPGVVHPPGPASFGLAWALSDEPGVTVHRTGLVAIATCLLLAGCSGLGGAQPASPPPATTIVAGTPSNAETTATLPMAPPTSAAPAPATVSTAPAPAPATSVPALGSWKPTCDDSSADAATMVGRLTAQPAFAVAKPSAVPGFADAAATVVKPLSDCPVAHSLRVKDALRVGSDADATAVVRTKLAALLRTVMLTLSGSKVGRFPFGSVSLAEARPVLVAVLGEPDETNPRGGCFLDDDGKGFTTVSWGRFTVYFDNRAGGAIHSWFLHFGGDHPANLELSGGMPFRATFAKLKQLKPGLTYSDLFANDAAPYYAEPSAHLYYGWDTSVTTTNDFLAGGSMHPCD